MRSVEARRRRAQSGQSIIEPLVASAILGATVVVGLLTLQSAVGAARKASAIAWGQCVARAELGAVTADPFDSSGGYPAPPGVKVTVTAVPGTSGVNELQFVAVQVADPADGVPLLADPGASTYKSRALAGSAVVDPTSVRAACAPLLPGS